jgi:hypothetical protein
VGRGKTTVLQLLKHRLDERPEIFCQMESPWEYHNRTDPTTALIDEVLGGLDAELTKTRSFPPRRHQERPAQAPTPGEVRQGSECRPTATATATAALTTTLPGGVNRPRPAPTVRRSR